MDNDKLPIDAGNHPDKRRVAVAECRAMMRAFVQTGGILTKYSYYTAIDQQAYLMDMFARLRKEYPGIIGLNSELVDEIVHALAYAAPEMANEKLFEYVVMIGGKVDEYLEEKKEYQ